MEGSLIYNRAAFQAVPAEPIEGFLWSRLLDHDADGVGESDRVVRGVWWKQEHLSFIDYEISELALVDNLEHHRAFVLVEPFGRLVDMVVSSSVWTSNNHDRHIFIIDAIVVDGRFE